MAITKDTLVEELLDIEQAAEVLMMRGLICGGCSECGAEFGTLADVAEKNGLKVAELVAEINQALDEAEEED